MIKVQGHYSPDNQRTEPGAWTADEVTALLKNGHMGSIHVPGFVIDGERMEPIFGGLIAIGNDTFVYEQEGKWLVPTWFRFPEGKVKKDVWIDPQEIEGLLLVGK